MLKKLLVTITTPLLVLISIATHASNLNIPTLAASSIYTSNDDLQRIVDNRDYDAINCTGDKSNSLCVGVGKNNRVAISKDLGKNWEAKLVTDAPDGYQLDYGSVSCTGSAPNAVCVAVGISPYPYVPYLIASTDNGNTWNIKSIAGLPTSKMIFFRKVSCTGSGSSAICTVVGSTLINEYGEYWEPVLVISTDGANTWKTISSIPNLSDHGFFMDVSCTGDSSNPLCIAVGTSIVVSKDGGQTWKNNTFDSLGPLYGVSCVGEGKNARCAVTASEHGDGTLNSETGNGTNKMITSVDGGDSWDIKTIAKIKKGYFNDINCTGEGDKAICAAVGNLGDIGTPSVVASTDGGNTWENKVLANAPKDSFLWRIGCTGQGKTAACAVAGGGFFLGSSTLVMSTDGGNTWESKYSE